MRWRLMLSVLLGMATVGLFFHGRANAQGLAVQGQQVLAEANRQGGELVSPPNPSSECVLVATKAAKFHFILGRLRLDSTCYNKCSRSVSWQLPPTDSSEGLAAQPCTETVDVTATRGIPSLHYRLDTPFHDAVIDVTDADYVRIESVLHRGPLTERMHIDQRLSGVMKISWKVTNQQGDLVSHDDFSTPSFVHLRASHPKRYASHLQPLLNRVLEQPPAECDAEQLLHALENYQRGAAELHADVRRCIDELRAPTRRARTEAENQLLAIGLPALALMQAQSVADLDFEQRQRMDEIRKRLQPRTSDTPSQLANWLVTDIGYWNMTARELTASQRELADSTVARVTGKPLVVGLQVADAN